MRHLSKAPRGEPVVTSTRFPPHPDSTGMTCFPPHPDSTVITSGSSPRWRSSYPKASLGVLGEGREPLGNCDIENSMREEGHRGGEK